MLSSLKKHEKEVSITEREPSPGMGRLDSALALSQASCATLDKTLLSIPYNCFQF